jgi:hypothetical protein
LIVALRLLVVAGVLALAGMVLLGLPGAFWLALAAPLAGLLTGRVAEADAAWPLAIIISLLWPWALPLAYLAAARLARGGRRVIATLAGTAVAAMLLALAFQLSVGRI